MFIQAESTDEILERYAFTADETNVLNENVVKSTESFLVKFLNISSNNINKAVKHNVAISLSGGVDSMVIAKILALLKDKLNIGNIFIYKCVKICLFILTYVLA